ncbi:unnamed protein product, partial [Urochloa humidicola]
IGTRCVVVIVVGSRAQQDPTTTLQEVEIYSYSSSSSHLEVGSGSSRYHHVFVLQGLHPRGGRQAQHQGRLLAHHRREVYNVTKFLEDHPGGDDVLLSSTAKDATDDFEDVGHNTTARAMMDEYLVGEIDATTIPTKVKYTPPK